MLDADDKHLKLWSCVGVVRLADRSMTVSLSTRVRATTKFGWLYMLVIGRTHKLFVSPTMLRVAVDHTLKKLRG